MFLVLQLVELLLIQVGLNIFLNFDSFLFFFHLFFILSELSFFHNNSLNQEDIKKITDIELKRLMARLVDMKYKITYDETLVEYLSKIGYDELYGARPLKRAIQDKVEDLLSEEVLTGKMIEGKSYLIKVVDENVVVQKKGR